MLTNCFRFAPRDSVPGLIAKICKYLKDHPGWSEEELKEQIKHFIEQTGVESFNGRTGAVVLNEDDVNNLKIESAYFAEGDETIDELDLVALYNQGVRFVFTNWNSVTSGYDLSFVLDYFGDSNDVVYYPMATGSVGGNIVSVNGKTGIVELSLSDILGDSGAQVKLCTATEFTSNTIATWNAYYEDGYRIVGVVNYDASAIDYIYLLRQDENNHQPIGISYDASDAYTPTNPPPYPVTSVNGDTGEVFTLRVDPSDPGVPTDTPAPINATTLNGKDAVYYATAESVNQLYEKVTDITDYVHITPGTDGEKAENVREKEGVTWTDGVYVNYQNGTISHHASYAGSEHYFDMPEGSRVFARFKNNTLYYPTVAFYGENKSYLSGEYPVLSSLDERDEYNGMYGYFYTIPDDAKYFRTSYGITAKANLEIYLIYPVKVGAVVNIPDLKISKSAIDGKTVVCFGDSLFGMYRGEDSAPAFIAKETGATVYNVGFGGCRMSVHPTSGYAAFSMWALAKAIAENNWTTQDAQAASGSSYFPEQLALLKSIDFSKVDIAVIHYGTNDFGAGTAVQIDNTSDPDDYNTLCGALRYSLDKLLAAYPKLRIYISLPVYRFWTDGSTTTYAETYLNKGGKTLPEFVEALRSVAAEYNLPVIDSYYGLGINKVNASTFLEDGTHLNTVGRERFGRYIGANLIAQQTSGKSGVDMAAVQALIDNSIGVAIGGAY